MRALVLDQAGVRFDTGYADPVPRRTNDVLVRVTTAGICETDVQLVKGYMGFHGVLGHEFVGVAQSGRWKGKRVVGEINCPCGKCETCRVGLGTHCPNRTVLGILNHDGAFADLVCLPEQNLHPVPDEIDDRTAVFTEPVAAAFQIPEQLELERGTSAIVLGDGRLGNLCAQVLALYDCDVTVVGKHRRKLELLARLGISTIELGDFTDRRCADLVVDCTGSASGLPLALELVRPRGTVVLKTTVAGKQTLALAPLVIDEVTLVGSRCGPFDRALQALARKEIEVSPLIDATAPLEAAPELLARCGSEPVLKLLLEVSRGD